MTDQARVNGLPVPPSWLAVPFDLDRVALHDSVFMAKRDRVLAYLRAYEPDRVLASFRRAAGLDDRGAQPPGGWDDSTGRLRGHYSGHLLTAFAQAWAGTGEQVFKDKVDAVVEGLAACQAGLAARVGEPGDPLPQPTWGEGRYGGGLVLSGDGQYVGLPDATVDGHRSVTLSMWVRPSELRSGAAVFEFGTTDRATMSLLVASSRGVPGFVLATNGSGVESVSGVRPVPVGTWTHLAATLDDGTATLYVDGVAVARDAGFTLSPVDLGAPKDNWIGRSHDGTHLIGSVDEAHVFARALTAAEVHRLATAPGAADLRGDLLALAFDDGAGHGVADASGRGWHATVVTGLGDEPGPSHPGYLAAYPETQFVQLEAYATYPAIWAPWYTAHKVMRGLLDAHALTGNPTALEVLRGMGDWAHHRLTPLPRAQLDRMWDLYIAGEYGGMNEVLADLSSLTGDPRHLETARRFDLPALLADCAADRDTLDGRHANQHLPQFTGYLRMAEQGAGAEYLSAARHFHAMVVDHRAYAHGGVGRAEVFRARDVVAGTVDGPTNAETCAAFNLLRLGRNLFSHHPSAALVDRAERTLVNQVLGSRQDADHEDDPLVAYMVPVGPGERREYGNVGTCCGGTGLENHTKYQDGIFSRSPDHRTLWVTLPVPAELAWPERGLRVTQEGSYPAEGPTTLTVHGSGWLDLRVRVPHWATRTTVSLNGADVAVEVGDDGFASVARDWSDADALVIDQPHPLRLEPTPDDPTLQALFHGPVLLVAESESTDWLTLPLTEDTLDDLVPDGDGYLLGDLRFTPMHHGTDAAYHAYHRRSPT